VVVPQARSGTIGAKASAAGAPAPRQVHSGSISRSLTAGTATLGEEDGMGSDPAATALLGAIALFVLALTPDRAGRRIRRRSSAAQDELADLGELDSAPPNR
jgi:hypothetical protein